MADIEQQPVSPTTLQDSTTHTAPGSNERHHLKWEEITYTVPVPGPKSILRDRHLGDKETSATVSKVLLDSVSGEARPGEVIAILGPSGAGKSTLLNVLAGRLPLSSGKVTLNGQTPDGDYLRRLGYVEQQDLCYETLSVRENLTVAAELKLPNSKYKAQQKRELVDSIIKELGLTACADSLVGNPLKGKSISGGERKRTCIGIELITNPGLLFLDEPATGLDSTTAYSIIKMLKDLAKSQHRTVLLTIHMPRPIILDLFDKIILLSKGRLVFFGSFKDAVNHFSSMGYTFPANENPIDLIMDIISGLDLKDPDETKAKGDVDEIAKQLSMRFQQSGYADIVEKPEMVPENIKTHSTSIPIYAHPTTTISVETPDLPSKPSQQPSFSNSMLHEIKILTLRAAKDTYRNTSYIVGKTVVNIALIFLLGATFWMQDRSQGGVQNRVGLLFIHSVHSFLGCLPAGTQVFPLRRDIIARERKAMSYRSESAFLAFAAVEFFVAFVQHTMYSLCVYFMVGLQRQASKVLLFWLATVLLGQCGVATGMILGGSTKDIQTALAIVPLINIISTLYAGNIANLAAIPVSISWLKFTTPIHYGYATLVRNEFSGLTVDVDCSSVSGASPYGCFVEGESYLAFLGLDALSVQANLGVMVGMMVGLFGVGCWAVRVVTAPRFYLATKNRGKVVA
ncbi:hypothetical protein HDV05_004267 [Chytridiales sp. JEL 0842]|nr:hypothetical protein HDV05_004267 [Chytridiales sp. JEL 0842]